MNLLRITTFATLTIFSNFLVGCSSSSYAINRTENYTSAWPSINYAASSKLSITVLDNRHYVVNGDKDSTFIGLMRGGYANPWDMHTENAKPLSENISNAMVSGFMNAGINAIQTSSKPNASLDEIEKQLSKDSSRKKLVLLVTEWKSDTYKKVKFFYDIKLHVYDKKGKLLAFHELKNKKTNYVDSPIDAARNVLTEILNTKKIKESIQEVTARPISF